MSELFQLANRVKHAAFLKHALVQTADGQPKAQRSVDLVKGQFALMLIDGKEPQQFAVRYLGAGTRAKDGSLKLLDYNPSSPECAANSKLRYFFERAVDVSRDGKNGSVETIELQLDGLRQKWNGHAVRFHNFRAGALERLGLKQCEAPKKQRGRPASETPKDKQAKQPKPKVENTNTEGKRGPGRPRKNPPAAPVVVETTPSA